MASTSIRPSTIRVDPNLPTKKRTSLAGAVAVTHPGLLALNHAIPPDVGVSESEMRHCVGPETRYSNSSPGGADSSATIDGGIDVDASAMRDEDRP